MSIADELRNSLLEVVENFAPMYEMAEGQRAELERRGWSPTAAETVALDILRGLISTAFVAGRPT